MENTPIEVGDFNVDILKIDRDNNIRKYTNQHLLSSDYKMWNWCSNENHRRNQFTFRSHLHKLNAIW